MRLIGHVVSLRTVTQHVAYISQASPHLVPQAVYSRKPGLGVSMPHFGPSSFSLLRVPRPLVLQALAKLQLYTLPVSLFLKTEDGRTDRVEGEGKEEGERAC